MKILVCEDNLIMLHTIAQSLAREGHEVLKAKDGKEGVAYLREGGVDLLITDINMPFTKGLELIRLVKSEMGGRIPVIVLSGINLQETMDHARELGTRSYLTKPVDPVELLRLVKEIEMEGNQEQR
jgi:DNA-binding response OmpR family regulator